MASRNNGRTCSPMDVRGHHLPLIREDWHPDEVGICDALAAVWDRLDLPTSHALVHLFLDSARVTTSEIALERLVINTLFVEFVHRSPMLADGSKELADALVRTADRGPSFARAVAKALGVELKLSYTTASSHEVERHPCASSWSVVA